MAKKTTQKIKKGDLDRVVLTETAPYEVPLFYSNHGFYTHCKKARDGKHSYPALFNVIVNNKHTSTVPMAYKIRKNEISLRTLSILHPSSQYRWIEFYNTYKTLICYFCSKSPISIRYPTKIGSVYFYKNSAQETNKYFTNTISTEETDKLYKHPASYFAYGGYSREYKFFNSPQFLELEKRYSHMWILDVSKCFDSIYTHSISWAVKSKSFIKNNLNQFSFGDKFDFLMRSSKHNETNGLVIGPEISRIFAEVIFQTIDLNVIDILKTEKLYFNKSYSIKRYVDDIFVFANSEEAAQKVSRVYSEELMKYNLHLNGGKSEKIKRPFFTKTSKTIHNAKRQIDEFLKRFRADLEKKEYEYLIEKGFDKKLFVPTEIYNAHNFKKDFIDSIKSFASADSSGGPMCSSYIIPSLARKTNMLLEAGAKALTKAPELGRRYHEALICMLDLMFYFYTVDPSVGASYHLSKTIILCSDFFKSHLSQYEMAFKQHVMDLFIQFCESFPVSETGRREFTTKLEIINILLATGEMGEDYLLEQEKIIDLFRIEDDPSYTKIMCCLYYIKDKKGFDVIRASISNAIRNHLREFSVIVAEAEKAHIFLDSITCPYLDPQFRLSIIDDFKKKFNIDLKKKQKDAAFLKGLTSQPWFVNWDNIDLIALLEKKELSAPY